VSRERLRRLRGHLTARQKSAEGVVGHVAGKASKELPHVAPARYAALGSMGTSS
jgi:hypothetical protein